MIILSGAGTVTAAFSPDDIAGLDWWLNADTIAGNDGDAVIQWPDSSSSGWDFGQATEARRPTLKVNLYNSHRAVRFGANKDLQQDPDAANMALANTLICVCTPSSNVDQYILRGNGGEGGPAFISGFSSKAFEYFHRAAGERATFATTASGLHILTLCKTDDVGNYEGFYDGNPTAVFSNPVNTADDWNPRQITRIGAFTGGASNYDGDITEILHWPSVLSAGNLTDVHDYLKDKYAIA